MTQLNSTSERILNAAERLFGEQGIAATSLREIVAQAEVNVASVNYHFGSKEELVKAVFGRRLAQVNSRRMEALEKLRQRYKQAVIPVEDLLRAFLRAPLDYSRKDPDGEVFLRLVARAHAETDRAVQEELFSQLKDVVQTFLAEFRRSLPELSEQERLVRLLFVAGAMVQTLLLPLKPMFLQMFVDGSNPDEMFEMLVSFCKAGLQAPGGGVG